MRGVARIVEDDPRAASDLSHFLELYHRLANARRHGNAEAGPDLPGAARTGTLGPPAAKRLRKFFSIAIEPAHPHPRLK
jgi:hypothetical protein